jgi:hypothetical protein
MRDNALYFPYINVPQSSWFTRVLLYWDQVSSIVPSEYIYHPEQLDPYMHELVTAGLVQQIIPLRYVDEVRCFEEAFLRYIDTRMRRSGNRIEHSTPRPTSIHIEKLGNIGKELVDRRLATNEKHRLRSNLGQQMLSWLLSPRRSVSLAQ